jgi:hypothetical protein
MMRQSGKTWSSEAERNAERARRFFYGAPLTLLGTAAFLPAWLFLVHAPRFAHAHFVAALVLPLIVLVEAAGIKNLVTCVLDPPLDYLTAFAFGVLLVFIVLLIFTGVFLYVLYS